MRTQPNHHRRVRARGALIVLVALATLALTASSSLADTYTVGTTTDTSTTACPSATAVCSLRQLILYVEAHPFPPDEITVPAGSYTLAHGQLLVTASMSIVGAGANTTLIQEPVPADRTTAGDRVFDIEALSGGLTPTVALSDLEVSGGDANADNPTDQYFGGDIRSAAVLTLTSDWVTNGFACSGGGVGNNAGFLIVEDSLISGNHSACGGSDSGGLENYGQPAASGPPATPDLPGHLVIDNSTIADNDAALAGGIFSWNDPNNTLTITNSTIADNSSQDEATACPFGAGCHARGPGGGLGLAAGTARVRNSIFAGNVEIAGGVTTQTNCAPGPGITSLGLNIDSGTDCMLGDTVPGQADESETNPLLGPLHNNGGPTETLALQPGSPALDKVPANGSDCPSTDQRGTPRAQGTACDIGAFELQVPPTCSAASVSTAAGGSTVAVPLSCAGTAPGPLTYAVLTNPQHGTLSNFSSASGVVDYTPAAGFSGTDTFTYSGSSSGGAGNTATVQVTVPPPPPPPKPPTPRLSPSMNWSFGLTKTYTTVVSMVASGVINGARLQITCSGSGCRFKTHSSTPPTPKVRCKKGHKCPAPKESTTDNLTALFKGWHLGRKATLTVSIEKRGYVGKVYIFGVRPPRDPSSKVTCLAPGSTIPGKGC